MSKTKQSSVGNIGKRPTNVDKKPIGSFQDNVIQRDHIVNAAINEDKLSSEVLNLMINIGDIRISPVDDKKTNEGYTDGSALSRSTYSDLFAKLGITWGVGDGSTTFNIPDFNAATLRGVGTSTQFTQNVTVALAQIIDDMLQGHWHDAYLQAMLGSTYDVAQTATIKSTASTGSVGSPSTDGTNGEPRTGLETTGKAIGVYFFIRLF